MNRKFSYLLPAAMLALISTSCLHSAKAQKTRAEGEAVRAEAEYTRAKADKVRTGDQARYVEVQVAPTPPAPTPEQPPPSPGSTYIWVPEYQAYSNGSWTWTPGHWSVPPQPAATWVPAHWEREGNGWLWVDGQWK